MIIAPKKPETWTEAPAPALVVVAGALPVLLTPAEVACALVERMVDVMEVELELLIVEVLLAVMFAAPPVGTVVKYWAN